MVKVCALQVHAVLSAQDSALRVCAPHDLSQKWRWPSHRHVVRPRAWEALHGHRSHDRKIKRIRTTGRVLLAPCDLMGNVLGAQIEASARELQVALHAHANALLAQ